MTHMNLKKHSKRLYEMTIAKNVVDIKKYLVSLSSGVKGPIWEYYIRELYDGNGVVAKVVGGTHDGGVDVVLFQDSSQQTVSMCIQAKNCKHPICSTKVVEQVENFKISGEQMYKCSKITIISINGFTKSAKKIANEDIKLFGWKHIEQLILNFDPKKKIVSTNKDYIYDAYFNMMFSQLLKYKERFGDCKVPFEVSGNRVCLARWVSNLRRARKKEELEQDKIKLLDSIGFCWDVFKEEWNHMFDKLQEYYMNYGHTKIKNRDDPVLIQWARRQVDKFLHKQLEQYQIDKLDSIGFFNDWL